MNLELLLKYNPILLALLGGLFTWSVTVLGEWSKTFSYAVFDGKELVLKKFSS